MNGSTRAFSIDSRAAQLHKREAENRKKISRIIAVEGGRGKNAGNRMPKRMHHAAHSVGIRPTVAEGRWRRRGVAGEGGH